MGEVGILRRLHFTGLWSAKLECRYDNVCVCDKSYVVVSKSVNEDYICSMFPVVHVCLCDFETYYCKKVCIMIIHNYTL